MKKLLMSVLMVTVISLVLVGCGEHAEHPTAAAEGSEHPTSEHPK